MPLECAKSSLAHEQPARDVLRDALNEALHPPLSRIFDQLFWNDLMIMGMIRFTC
jgi:hypothetical protein